MAPPVHTALDRRAMLAKIHLGKQQLGLDYDAYRDVLERLTGHRSAAECTDQQLAAVLAEYRRQGWAAKPSGKPRRPRSEKGWVRKIWAIWGDLRPLLDNATDETLRAFVMRQTRSRKNPEGIADPEWLDPAEANKVITGLQGWLGRVRAGQGGTDVGAE